MNFKWFSANLVLYSVVILIFTQYKLIQNNIMYKYIHINILHIIASSVYHHLIQNRKNECVEFWKLCLYMYMFNWQLLPEYT